MTASPQYDVYLSYNQQERKAVEQLERELVRAGLSVWRDQTRIEAGNGWQHAINHGLAKARFIAICVGRGGLSREQLSEISEAVVHAEADPDVHLTGVMLPGLPDDFDIAALPDALRKRHWLDLRSGVHEVRGKLDWLRERLPAREMPAPRASPSVEATAGCLNGEVTAAAFVRELLKHHPEYGDKRALSVALDVDPGARAWPDDWVEEVRKLLPAGTATQIHGRLLIAGLARLEPTLRQQLERDGFLAAVEREISEPLDMLFAGDGATGSRIEPGRPDDHVGSVPARPSVFINYAATSMADTRGARELATQLRKYGIDPWIAPAGIVPGVPLAQDEPLSRLAAGVHHRRTIVEAIELSAAFVICVGSGELREGGRDELAQAAKRVERDPSYRVAAALLPGWRPADLNALENRFPRLRSFDLSGFATVRDLADFVRGGGSDAAAAAPVDRFELAGGYSQDAVDPTHSIPIDHDRLGVRDDVKMLASLIADETTPMPLSVGLFGEWGSGKSTFMGLLRGQVEELAGKPGYHADIHQIGFNAWHYADTNLWASLGHEIFEQLAGTGNSAQRQREAIREQLTDKLHARKELEDATERAKAETVRLGAQIDAAAAQSASSARIIVRAAASSVARSDLARAWARLGVADEVEQGRRLAAELRGSVEEYDALRTTLSRLGGRALAVGFVLVLVSAIAALLFERWAVGGGLAALGTVLGSGLVIVGRVRSGLSSLRKGTERLKQELDSEKLKGLDDELRALREAEVSQDVLQAQLDEVVAHAGALGRELAELSPGRRLYSFVSELAEGQAYRRHLGMISTVRRDFEQLIALMADWKEAAQAGTGEGGQDAPLPIDRIVLYIDDLDRCSPRQVVDVLQAVHLLLALELFVVVVGVDPRWLLRSLQNQYDELLSAPGNHAPGDDWQVSPQDYLEKIFNIPFALPLMTPTSFENLLESLARETDVDPRQADEDGAAQRTQAPAAVETDAEPPAENEETDQPLEQRLAEAAIAAEAGSQIDLISQGHQTPADVRQLTVPERKMLTALSTLVSTPREA